MTLSVETWVYFSVKDGKTQGGIDFFKYKYYNKFMNSYRSPRSEVLSTRNRVNFAAGITVVGGLILALEGYTNQAAPKPLEMSCVFSEATKPFTFIDDHSTISHAAYDIEGVTANTCYSEAKDLIDSTLNISGIPHHGETTRIPVSVTIQPKS